MLKYRVSAMVAQALGDQSEHVRLSRTQPMFESGVGAREPQDQDAPTTDKTGSAPAPSCSWKGRGTDKRSTPKLPRGRCYEPGGRGAETGGRSKRAGSMVRSVSGLKPLSMAQITAWVRLVAPILR